MAIIQCKICGGDVDLPVGMTMGECPYCESMVTFPKQSSDRQMQLYQRAEQLRLAGSFDKAAEMYEAVIKEDPSDAEAYWGLLLSNWGIEYVEDPVTKEHKPTCHRVQFDSIMADPDYRQTLEKASPQEAEIYKREAQRIAKIQKDILRISSQEKPFDVFICYKETDENGKRTRDSVYAQDIYDKLTEKGFKVFFARITLEDKLGQQYEPYIFAALNSAKVMLVIGSRKEYFEAVWVRNEWNRFLRLMRNDKSKMLIPCYRDKADMLPDEFSYLQGKDIASIGFMQDLIRGIVKIIGNVRPEESQEKRATYAAVPVMPQAENPVMPQMSPMNPVMAPEAKSKEKYESNFWTDSILSLKKEDFRTTLLHGKEDVKLEIIKINRWFNLYASFSFLFAIFHAIVLNMEDNEDNSGGADDMFLLTFLLIYPIYHFTKGFFLKNIWSSLKQTTKDSGIKMGSSWYIWIPGVTLFTLIPFHNKISDICQMRSDNAKYPFLIVLLLPFIAFVIDFIIPYDEFLLSSIGLFYSAWHIKKATLRIMNEVYQN